MKKKILITLIVVLVLAVIIFFASKFMNMKDTQKDQKNMNENEQIDDQDVAQEDDDIYFKVLKNEIKYVNEDNKETLFKEYMENYKESTENPKIKYTVFDFDNDSKNEMIVMIEAFNDGFYLILNNEDGTVYGFEEVYRGLKDLKTDGTYLASGGASSNGILRDKFEKNKRVQETLAEMDMGKFQIDGKDVSEEEYDKYLDEFSKKENVEFKNYVEKYEFDEKDSTESKENLNSENKTTDNNETENTLNKASFEEGVYTMTKPSLVGTDAEGFDTTITFKDGKVSYLESYWGNKKNGTYTVEGNTLIVNYTSGNEVDSINGDMGTVTMNETEEYKIEGRKIILQKTSADVYYTAGSNVYELGK